MECRNYNHVKSAQLLQSTGRSMQSNETKSPNGLNAIIFLICFQQWFIKHHYTIKYTMFSFLFCHPDMLKTNFSKRLVFGQIRQKNTILGSFFVSKRTYFGQITPKSCFLENIHYLWRAPSIFIIIGPELDYIWLKNVKKS